MDNNEKKKAIEAILKMLQNASPEKVSELLVFIESYVR